MTNCLTCGEWPSETRNVIAIFLDEQGLSDIKKKIGGLFLAGSECVCQGSCVCEGSGSCECNAICDCMGSDIISPRPCGSDEPSGSSSLLSPEELEVFQAHARAWRRVLDQHLPFAMIVEETANFRPDEQSRETIEAALKQVNRQNPEWDVLLLGRCARLKAADEAGAVVKPQAFWGIFAYILRASGAVKLLQTLESNGFDRPVENFVSDVAADGKLNVFALNPCVVKEGPNIVEKARTLVRTKPRTGNVPVFSNYDQFKYYKGR